MVRREKAKKRPAVPDDISQLVIENEWAQTAGANPDRFLIYDNGRNADARVVIFASRVALTKMASSSTWFMDGCFAMSPKGFKQMYVIRVPLKDSAITTVYALLPNKSQVIYEEMLRAIMSYCETINLFPDPTTILCDFELAVIRAVEQVLGQDVAIQGCFYHFTQATWRKIQELQLSRRYKTDEDFRQFCAKLDGLAFLPVADVPGALAALRDDAPDGAEELVEYFSTNCVNGTYRRVQTADEDGTIVVRVRRSRPRFPPALWNVHDATINNEPRTNNQCEGYNNRFAYLVGHTHPDIWEFIDAIKGEECYVSTVVHSDNRGDPPKKRP